MNNVSQFVKENRTFFTLLIICIGLLIVFVLTAMFSGAWPSPSISGQILSALAGAVVAAMITLFLLLGQTSSEEKKERNSKVFEEKLKIYQDFLKCMCEVIEDRKVTPEEAIRLEFQTSYITMHTESEHIKEIATHVKNIVDSLSEKNDQLAATNRAENDSKSNGDLMKSLFSIVNIFRKELYDITPTDKDTENNIQAAKSFSSIMDAVEIPSKTDITPDADLKQNIKDFTSELLENISVNREFWDEVNTDESNENGTYIRLENNEGAIVLLTYEDNQYFNVHLEYDDTHDAYKHMKWRFGGRQNKWGWWRYLDGSMKNIAQTDEMKNRNWNGMLEILSKQMKEIIAYVEAFEQTRKEIYEPLKVKLEERLNNKNFRMWIYYDYCVALDYEFHSDSDPKEKERLFIDIKREESGLYSIIIGNREENASQLNKRLESIHCLKVNRHSSTYERYVAQTNFSAEKIIEEIEHINQYI